ncbi:MAG: hypothetical protein ACYCQJ_13030 [Nitrososphaerales archaeon]
MNARLSLVFPFLLLLVVGSGVFASTQGPVMKVSNTVSSSCFGLTQAQVEKIQSEKIALIKPEFTTSAYQEATVNKTFETFNAYHQREAVTVRTRVLTGFYGFYDMNGYGSLNVSVVNEWGWDSGLYSELSGYSVSVNCGLGSNLKIIQDTTLSTNSSSLDGFNVVILPFEEYATQSEYNNLKTFVSNGGTLISLNGDSLTVLVSYSPSSDHVALVEGHGFFGNGSRSSVFDYFASQDTNVLGSNFCCFNKGGYNGTFLNVSNPIGAMLSSQFGKQIWANYTTDEDASITNWTDTSVIGVAHEGSLFVGPYIHQYGRGQVVSSGIEVDNQLYSMKCTILFVYDSLIY